MINNIYKNLSQGIHNLEINLDEYNFKHGAYIVMLKQMDTLFRIKL